jgi:hypothetical protein
MRSYTVLSKLASWSIRYFLFSTPIALRKGLVWAQRCLFYTYKFLQKKILFSNVPKLLSSSTSISNNNNNSDSLQFLNFETFRWYPPLHSFGLVPSRYFFLIVPLSDVLRYHHCHDLFSFSNFFIQVSLLLHFSSTHLGGPSRRRNRHNRPRPLLFPDLRRKTPRVTFSSPNRSQVHNVSSQEHSTGLRSVPFNGQRSGSSQQRGKQQNVLPHLQPRPFRPHSRRRIEI